MYTYKHTYTAIYNTVASEKDDLAVDFEESVERPFTMWCVCSARNVSKYKSKKKKGKKRLAVEFEESVERPCTM